MLGMRKTVIAVIIMVLAGLLAVPQLYVAATGSVQIVKSGPGPEAPPVYPGDTIEFTLTLYKTGEVPVAWAEVWDDMFYAGLDIYTIFRYTLDPTQVSELNSTGTIELSVLYTVPCDAGGHFLDDDAYVYAEFEDGTDGMSTNDHDVWVDRPTELDCSPQIDLEKLVNGQDADTPEQAVPVRPGDDVAFTYIVRNTGNAALFDLVVVDDNETPEDPTEDIQIGVIANLAPGQSREFERTVIAQSGLHTNMAQVCGTSSGTSGSQPVCDDDPGNYTTPPTFTLGDRVWYDQNQNGIQDANELGYNGVTVDLYANGTCSGSPMASTTTGAGPAGFGDGYYQFTNLLPGPYCVQFGNIPAGWSISPANQGANDAVDSDANASGKITKINLTADDPNEDMGIYVPGTLGDTVVCVSTGEGLANITVYLFEDFDCNGVPDGPAIAKTGTDATGFYRFAGLEVALAGDPNNSTCYIVEVDTNDADLGTCNVPIPPTEYNPPLDSNNPDGPDNDFKFEEPLLECNLVVNKLCQVTPAPTNLFCTSGIVATTLRYTGPTILGATVEIDPDKGPTVVYSNIDLISEETVLALPGENGFSVDARPDESELGSKTAIRVNGVAEVIHTSCSAPYLAGQPAPLDNPKGAPSPNWFVVNFVDKDSPEVVAPPAPPEPSETCEVTLGPVPSCLTVGKPNSLSFRFTGGTCADSDNSQGSKFICTDGSALDPTQPVQIVMLDDADKITVAPSDVSVGEMVNIARNDGSNFASNTMLEIRQGSAMVQRMTIHTSCSQPLVAGDVFGGLELVEFNGQRAGAEVTYIYRVSNLGSPLTGVTLTDRVNGEVMFSSGPFDLPTSEPVVIHWVTEIAETTVNEAVASGLLANGAECSASDTAIVTVVEPCATCKGGTVELTFQYVGTQAANVVVYDDDSEKVDKILFQGLLQPSDEFTIKPRQGETKLENDISIWVGGVFNAKVHTSCSKPIGPGLIAGDFLIVEGRSKDSGLMCPLNTCAPSPGAIVFHDREARLDVANLGDLGLEISRIVISWPAANGYLDEVKRGGDAIHKRNLAPPFAIIENGWEGDEGKRTIPVGDTNTLKFKFENDASTTPGGYSIQIEFTYGCSIRVMH